MPLENSCVVKSCDGIAMWGMGTVRGGSIRFACAAHRHLIGVTIAIAGGAPPASGTGEAAACPVAASPPRASTFNAKPGSADQGSLL